MTDADALAERFGDRFDQRVADGLRRVGPEHAPGVPQYLGMQITDVGPGWLVCEVALRPELHNPAGVAHGSVVASLVDHVLGCTVMPHAPGNWPATLEFKLNYLAPAREGTLAARAELVSITTRTAVVAVEVTNEGRAVATALGTVMIVPPRSGT